MKQIRDTFYGLFHNKVDALGLAVFRIAFTLVLLAEVCQLFRFRNMIYDQIPFVYRGDIDVTLIFLFYFIVLGMMLLGLFTRVAMILNYVLGVIIFSSASHFEYHVFYAYLGVNFLMMFMPVSRVFSLDSLIEKIRYTHIGRPYQPDRKVLEINYLMPVFLAIGLVYFDSVFQKVTSPMWMDGLGMWMPSSLPMIVWNDTSWILNQEYLVKFFGYLVVVFETVFLFLFWFKRFRMPFFFLGTLFHLGILITYPIPWFALAVMGVYLLLIPPGFWVRIANLFKSKSKTYRFYYDAECPLCNKVVVAIRHFDIFNKVDCVTVQAHAAQESALQGIDEQELLINIHGVAGSKVYKGYWAYVGLLKHMIYTAPVALLLAIPGISHLGQSIYRFVAGNRLTERCTSENCNIPVLQLPPDEKAEMLIQGWTRLRLTQWFWKWVIIVMTVAQCIIILGAPLIQKAVGENTSTGRALATVAYWTQVPFQKLVGVTIHPVFMYNIHFDNYNHIFKFECNENGKRVPLLDDNGMVTDSYANGAMWVHYNFRTSSHTLVRGVFEPSMFRYLSQFQHENNLPVGTYTIYVKEIETTDHWQHDFLRRQMAKPWKAAGTCKVSAGQYEFNWTPEMLAVFASE